MLIGILIMVMKIWYKLFGSMFFLYLEYVYILKKEMDEL